MSNYIISVDGTAGSGKRRIAKYIAKKYKFFHLDSGILYRRLALLILKKNLKYNNDILLKQFLKKMGSLSPKSHASLRKEKVGMMSSRIATKIIVRNYINNQQKTIVRKKLESYKGCVIDGRDIGSKVFKDAKIKLFINVKSDIRAKRRHKQLIALGEKSIYAKILKEINLRDKLDINRKTSPLVVPKDAIIIDNSSYFKFTTQLINQALSKIE